MKKLFTFAFMMLAMVGFTFGQGNQLTTHSEKGVKGVNFVRDAPALLYSQMTPGAGTAVASQIFPDLSNCFMQGADDFIVPAGGWTIQRVEVIGTYGSYPGPASFFDVFFYADNSGMPGAEQYHGAGLAYTTAGPIFGVTLTTPAVLPEGHYWVSVMPTMSFGVGGQWYWQSQTTPLIGYEFHWQDPCQLASVFPTWTTASVAFPVYNIYDLCFALYGTNAVPISNWALILGAVLIGVFVVIRYRRIG